MRRALLSARRSAPPPGPRVRPARPRAARRPGRPDLQRVVRRAAPERARRRHGDLAQRLAARARRGRRGPQLRLPAAADGRMFEHRFDTPGTYAYLCQLHPTMRGDIAVHRLLLDAAKEPAAPGKPYALKGRAALPEGARSRSRPTASSRPRPPSTRAARSPPRSRRPPPRATRAVAGGESAPARPGARARPQGQRDAAARPRYDRRQGHARHGRRHRRAAAQAQGALRLVARQGRQDQRRRDACASRSPAAARSRPGCCSRPPTRPPSSRAAPRSAYARRHVQDPGGGWGRDRRHHRRAGRRRRRRARRQRGARGQAQRPRSRHQRRRHRSRSRPSRASTSSKASSTSR